jgi:hypothetical protein
MTTGLTCEKCGRETQGNRKLCSTCRSRKFREENPTYHRDYKREITPEAKVLAVQRNRARSVGNLAAIDAARTVPCVDCGETFPPECMDFDHIPERGPKLFNISCAGSRRPENVLAEIAKCDVVCSNCHRTRTRSRAKGPGMY